MPTQPHCRPHHPAPFRRLLAAAALSGLSFAAAEPIRLWQGDAPGALGQAPQDIPTLTRFTPPAGKATGAAVVICPGGGYGALAGHEGQGYAEYLAANGIDGFVLQYRLGSHGYRHPVMLNDAQRAIRLVRANASQWGLDPHRIGIMGSSAGGHLASTAIVHFDAGNPAAAEEVEKQSCRPDFGILCYAVISMRDGVTHGGSRANLLGNDPDPKLIAWLSSDEQVTKETPPCFVWSTGEDTAVPVENSMRFVAAMQKAGVAYDFHVYQKGPHGIGLATGRPGLAKGEVHPWGKDLVFWFNENGWLKQR